MESKTSPSSANTGLDRLEAVEKQLASAVAGVRRRNRWMLGVWLAANVFTAGYMGVAYTRFAHVDPDMTVTMAATEVKERLPEILSSIRQQAHRAAPSLMRHGEEQLRAAPAQLEASLTDHAERQLAAQSPAVADELFWRLRTVLDEQLARQKAADNGMSAEERYRSTIEHLHRSTREYISQVFDRQLDATTSVVDRLEHLARDENLTERERLQREVIRSMLMLWQQYQTQAREKTATTAGV